MILYQKKVFPYFLRLLGAIFNPIILIFFVIPIGALVYYALQGDINTSPVKGMWLGAGVLAFISAFMYYNRIRNAVARLKHVELSPEGLKVQKVKYDTVVETHIPIKETELELRKNKHVNNKSGRVTYSYSLQFFDRKDIDPVCELKESDSKLREILESIEKQNLIPLKAAEKDFLVVSRLPENRLLVMYRKAQLIIFIGILVYGGYKVVNYFRTTPILDLSSWSGSWKVMAPEESAGMLITFNADSSAVESIFNERVKWKFKEAEGLSHQPDVLTLSTENAEGWSSYEYSILGRTDSLVELKRNFDNKIFQLLKSNESSGVLSEFKKLIGIFDHSFLVPTNAQVESEILNNYLPDWQPGQLPSEILLKGNWIVLTLESYPNTYRNVSVAVFNPKSEGLHSYQNFAGVREECPVSISTINRGNSDLILVQKQCKEGDAVAYQINDSGKLVALNEVNPNPPLQATLTNGLTRKWYNLFDGENGKERHQICGSESFIEIIETEDGLLWHQQGYQDVYEETVVDYYLLDNENHVVKLKSANGEVRELLFEVSDLSRSVYYYTIHEQLFYITAKPELFVVNNDQSECLKKKK